MKHLRGHKKTARPTKGAERIAGQKGSIACAFIIQSAADLPVLTEDDAHLLKIGAAGTQRKLTHAESSEVAEGGENNIKPKCLRHAHEHIIKVAFRILLAVEHDTVRVRAAHNLVHLVQAQFPPPWAFRNSSTFAFVSLSMFASFPLLCSSSNWALTG